MKRFLQLTQIVLVAFLGGLLLTACDFDPANLAGGVTPTTTSANSPSLKIVVKPAGIKIGEEVTITGSVSNMGIPEYTLLLDDKSYARDNATAAFKNAINSKVEFVSAKRLGNDGVFVLRGIGAGKLKINMSASGEIAVQSGGQTAYVFSGVGGSPFELIITAS